MNRKKLTTKAVKESQESNVDHPILNTKTQLKFDQLAIGDYLLVKHGAEKILSHWRIAEITNSKILLTQEGMIIGSGLTYTPEEVQELEFCRIIE